MLSALAPGQFLPSLFSSHQHQQLVSGHAPLLLLPLLKRPREEERGVENMAPLLLLFSSKSDLVATHTRVGEKCLCGGGPDLPTTMAQKGGE